MFAHNNTEIDYIKLAYVNSLLIQKHMGLDRTQITVVTDPHSLEHGKKTIGIRKMQQAFKNTVVVEKDIKFKQSNVRTYKDTSHTAKQLQFYNVNRCDAYDISPYDETLLIDVDYLIQSDSLNQVWGHNNELMMNWEFQDILNERKFPNLDRLGPTGITMYWATVVYFKKSTYSETFFNFVKHVKNNKEYYADLYKWYGTLYRNDYSFSIAAHMISGYQDKGVPQLPHKLYKTFDTDDVEDALDSDDLLLYLEKTRSPGDFILARWKGVDLHVMNKWAINRISEKMIKHLITAKRPAKKVSTTTEIENVGT